MTNTINMPRGVVEQAERWIAQQMLDNGWPQERIDSPPEGSHLFNLRAALSAAAEPVWCRLCDNTGDIHSPTGEWRGVCPICNHAPAVPDAAKPEPKSLFTVDLAEHSIWKVRYYGSSDLKGYNIYAFQRGGLTHGERIANLGEDGDTAEALCLAHNELAMALADEKETARQLNAALREATEQPTFMGEPALAARPETQGEQPLLVRDLAEIICKSVPAVSAVISELGLGNRSTNMAMHPDEAIAVAKRFALLSAGTTPAVPEPNLTADEMDELCGGQLGASEPVQPVHHDVPDAAKPEQQAQAEPEVVAMLRSNVANLEKVTDKLLEREKLLMDAIAKKDAALKACVEALVGAKELMELDGHNYTSKTLSAVDAAIAQGLEAMKS